MLRVTIPQTEFFNEEEGTFYYTKPQVLQLEHSLVSLSKWESKWLKPFIAKGSKTREETIDYIKCMTLTQNVQPEVYLSIPSDVVKTILKYIDSPMTATSVRDTAPKSGKKEVITSELIYYWMITFNIPFECQKWHLNRLLTLIRVCSAKAEKPRRLSKSEVIERNLALNKARREQLNSKG